MSKKNTVFVLFQTDQWKTHRSRVLFGIFSTETRAIEAAKKNNLFSYNSEVLVVEGELDEFNEL